MTPPAAPRVGIGCLVMHAGRTLMVRNHAGFWSTPGGNLDLGESPEEAAVRETREETGVAVRDLRFLALTDDRLPGGRHYLTVWFRADADDPALHVHDTAEIAEAGWFDPAALPAPLHLYMQNLLAGRTLPPLRPDSLWR